MNDHLNNEINKIDIEKIKFLCTELDQKHPMERKIKFLLDIRGYIKVNNIQGSYFEFGSFKSQMQYAAFNILEKTNMINYYVGFDTFNGEPKLTENEQENFTFIREGSFKSNYLEVDKFVKENIGSKGFLLQGDFRSKKILKQSMDFFPISIGVIDCNIISSIKASLKFLLKNIKNGGIIFIDDYYTNLEKGIPVIDNLLNVTLNKNNKKIIDLGYYPPFARSFIVVDKN